VDFFDLPTSSLSASMLPVSSLSASVPLASSLPSAGIAVSRKGQRPAAVTRDSAASEVIEAAKSQKAYYDAKLQMAKEKHGAKMRILALKEYILKRKLEQ